MRSTRSRHAPPWAGLALAAAVALAGCGTATPAGSAGGSGSGGDSASVPAVTATDATATVIPPTNASASTEPTGGPTTGPTVAPTVERSSDGSTADASATSEDGGQPSASAGTTEADASAPRCHTSDLLAVIEGRGGAAGTLSAQILVTNHSDHACAVYGYGGMQLYAADGSKVPTNMVRDPATPPAQVVLNPGDHAYSALNWSDVVTSGDRPAGNACQPLASTAHITPPDETAYLNAHWGGSPVCDQGRIDQGAYRAGSMPQQ